jgi:hypothetical protein
MYFKPRCQGCDSLVYSSLSVNSAFEIRDKTFEYIESASIGLYDE